MLMRGLEGDCLVLEDEEGTDTDEPLEHVFSRK